MGYHSWRNTIGLASGGVGGLRTLVRTGGGTGVVGSTVKVTVLVAGGRACLSTGLGASTCLIGALAGSLQQRTIHTEIYRLLIEIAKEKAKSSIVLFQTEKKNHLNDETNDANSHLKRLIDFGKKEI